jgi:hypothetical protein
MTTNTLYLSDNQGQMLYGASPQEGQHHDLFQLKELFEEICQFLAAAGIERRYVMERANAWQDQFKALVIRYETRADTWLNWLILSFMVIFIRRIKKKRNPKQLQSVCIFVRKENAKISKFSRITETTIHWVGFLVIRHKRQDTRGKTKNCLSEFYTNESVFLILWNYFAHPRDINAPEQSCIWHIARYLPKLFV